MANRQHHLGFQISDGKGNSAANKIAIKMTLKCVC
jgi:hypothetical protein